MTETVVGPSTASPDVQALIVEINAALQTLRTLIETIEARLAAAGIP